MDAGDTYMVICAGSLFLGLILDDAGMRGAAAVFWGICIVCVVLGYCSMGRTSGTRRRKRKKKRR